MFNTTTSTKFIAPRRHLKKIQNPKVKKGVKKGSRLSNIDNLRFSVVKGMDGEASAAIGCGVLYHVIVRRNKEVTSFVGVSR
jgi:hypothetical protein